MSAKSKIKHAIIICHPSADSFTLAVAERYASIVKSQGHEVVIRDLYRMDFDPVLKEREQPGSDGRTLAADVACELSMLGGTDVFVLVYPIWFGTAPAMLKGYIDRVLGAGFPYGAVRDRRWHPLLAGKRLLSFTSSGTSKSWMEAEGALYSLRRVFDDYLTKAFSLDGFDHFHFGSVTKMMGAPAVHERLLEVEEAARQVCARLAANDVSMRDATDRLPGMLAPASDDVC